MSRTSPAINDVKTVKCKVGKLVLTFELNLAIKVRVVEFLHWDLLLAMVLSLKDVVLNRDVLLNVLAWRLDLGVLPPPIHTHKRPVPNRNGYSQKQHHEHIGLEPAAVDNGQDALDKPRNGKDSGSELDVGEGPIAFYQPYRGCVFNSRGVRNANTGRHVGGLGNNSLAKNEELPWSLVLFVPMGTVFSHK